MAQTGEQTGTRDGVRALTAGLYVYGYVAMGTAQAQSVAVISGTGLMPTVFS